MSAISDKSNSSRIAEVKAILRSLLISEGSRDVSIRHLNSVYREMEGSDIPYKEFNFPNLIDFLRSMTDTLRIEFNRENTLCAYHVNTAKSAHISSLVARQKKPVKKTKPINNKSYNNFYYNRFYEPKLTPNYMEILNRVLQEIKYSTGTHNGINKSEILSRVKKYLSNDFSNSYTIRTLNEHLYKLSHMLIIRNDFVYFKDQPIKNYVQRVPSNIQSHLLINTTNQVSIPNVDCLNVPMAENDCFSIPKAKDDDCFNIPKAKEDDCFSIPKAKDDNCRGTPTIKDDNCPGIPTIKDDCSKIVENDENLLNTSSSTNLINERTKIRLEKLIQMHPEGIWCFELPKLYKSNYNLNLDYNDMGFNSITEFVAALPDIFRIVEPPNIKRQMVIYAKATNLQNQTKTLASLYNFDDLVASNPEPVPGKLSTEVSRKLVPDGVMNLNETVDTICVATLACEEYIEVNISEIFTPSFFWINLRQNKKKIKTLMKELDEFYRKVDLDAYKIPQVILEAGLNIACLYSNMWHRGMVKKIKPDGYVLIFFYDYGTVKTYNPNELYFLNKKFSILPAQAIACGLYNIKPIESNQWSNNSINKFIDKIWNIPLIAIISTIDENNTMMITLTDTSDDTTDLHINDWMVENELAEWGKMVCMRNNFLFQHYQQYFQKKWQDVIGEFKNKILGSENIVCSELENTCTQNYVSHATKIAAIKNYNLSNYESNNKSIYASNATNKNEFNFPNDCIYNQYKKSLISDLKQEKQNNSIAQQSCTKSCNDLKMSVAHIDLNLIKCIQNNLKYCDKSNNHESSEIIEFQNITKSSNHIKSITDSVQNSNKEPLLNSYNKLLCHLQRLKNKTS